MGGVRRIHGGMRPAHTILVRKPQGIGQFGSPRNRWNDNIKTDIGETRCKIVDYMQLVQDTVKWWDILNRVMNLVRTELSQNMIQW